MSRFLVSLVVSSTLLLNLTGCVAMQAEQAQREARASARRAQKVAALQTGTPLATVRNVWGSPTSSTFTHAGGHTVQTLRYGYCATGRYMTNGVVFVTFTDGAVSRYSIVRC